MPLVSIKNELAKAQAGAYALPMFDSFDMAATEGIIAALEAERSPAMIGVYAHYIDMPSARPFAALIRAFAEQATVPVSLMLDHGASLEACAKALAFGFTDIMYDGSSLPLDENIANTRLVVRAAHAVGASVEAELGHVGTGDEYGDFGSQRKGFTDPADAERFVAETGVDLLAVAIGSAHGVYRGEPHLDLELLEQIRARVPVPLALHGGTGLSEAQYRGAIKRGIAKINIFTDLGLRSGARVAEIAKEQHDPYKLYFAIADATRDTFTERCRYYLNVFGAAQRA